jgi:hypothetical protein
MILVWLLILDLSQGAIQVTCLTPSLLDAILSHAWLPKDRQKERIDNKAMTFLRKHGGRGQCGSVYKLHGSQQRPGGKDEREQWSNQGTYLMVKLLAE